MKKRMIPLFATMLTLFAVAFMATQTQAGVVKRKAAEFRNFNGTETATAAIAVAGGGGGGVPIWTHTVAIRPGEKVLYITMSTTGDSHEGAAVQFSCLVDGVACNPGPPGAAAAPPGWITLLKTPANTDNTNCRDGSDGPGDCHDNSITYQWCKVIQPPPRGPRTRIVQLKMAASADSSGSSEGTVFIESAHFYIDVQKGSAAGTPTPTCIEGAQ